MSMQDLSIKEFSDVLASKTSVPGGGGAAALMGALGSALCSMTGNFTTGKKTYAAYEEDVQRMLQQGEALRGRLLQLIDADAQAFEPLAQAYSLPKDTPHYEEIMAEATLNAIKAPFAIMQACCEAIDLLEEMAIKGSRMMISDVGCGAVVAGAGLQAAAMNVFINTKSMRGHEEAESFHAQAQDMLAVYVPKANNIATSIMEGLQGGN